VPENILAVDRGYNELLFVGDIVNFPQNAIGVATRRIQENPHEVYGMVRAALRALYFALEPRNRDEVISIVMKQWKLSDRRIASEMLRQFNRGMARDLMAKPEGMQLMIDLVREDSKVTQPFSLAQVVDYTFVEKARRDLGSSR
jgi:ABC-type nitrate/sulfonate/bicarbonate transport system substrate-binding protein